MPRTSMSLHHTLRAGALGTALLAALAACSDAPSAPGRGEPSAPRLAIQDGAHNAGNEKFYWLAPLVKDPVTTGTFDAGLQPVVQVCEVTAGGCGAIVAEFSRQRGTGSEVVKVDHAAQRYFVNWHTGQCRTGACDLDPAKTYRVRVLLGGLEAGHADLDVVTSQAQARNVNTGEFIPLVDGKVLQVRFRIEEGIALESPTLAAFRGRFRPLGERYGDAGLKPATGRSGSAALAVRALLNADGTTDLEVASGSLAAPGTLDPLAGTGTLEHVQLKALSSSGEAIWTRNFTGLEAGGTFSLHAEAGMLTRHLPFQVQANVKDIDPSRSDVVTVQGVVGRRPDPAIENIQHPAQARIDQRVTVGAAIRERNGDVGAEVRCVLYVDGARADEVAPVWVDAGDMVSCALATTFATAGTKSLKVALEGVTPADDDPSAASNEATGSITVTGGNDFYFSAYAFEVDYSEQGENDAFYGEYRKADHSPVLEQRSSTTRIDRRERSQGHGMHGWGPLGLTLPLKSVRLTASSDGAVLQDLTLESFPYTWYYTGSSEDGRFSWFQGCTYHSETVASGRVGVNLCTYGNTDRESGVTWEYTDFSLNRWAGRATYYSVHAWEHHDYRTGVQGSGVWEENFGLEAGPDPLPALGATYRIAVAFTDVPAGGTAARTFVAETEPAMEMSAPQWSGFDYSTTPQCWRFTQDAWWDAALYYVYSGCDRRKMDHWYRTGYTWGQPSVTP